MAHVMNAKNHKVYIQADAVLVAAHIAEQLQPFTGCTVSVVNSSIIVEGKDVALNSVIDSAICELIKQHHCGYSRCAMTADFKHETSDRVQFSVNPIQFTFL